MSKTLCARAALALIAILIWTVSLYGQAAHTLQGKVLLANGSPPANSVKVTLTFNGMRVYETFTDLSGRFSFTALHRGVYELTAEGDERTFETTKVNAEVAAFGSAPQSFTQNIQLRGKSGAQLPPPGVTSIEALDANIPQRAREAYKKGSKRAEDDKPEEAVKLFKEAIDSYPQFYSAHLMLAEQCTKLKRYAEAEAAYQNAINLKSDAAAAHVGLGVVRVKQKMYAEAIPPLRRSIEIEKQSSPSFLFLGLAEMMTGDYQSAEPDLLRAYEIGKATIAHIYLANLYELKREPAKAIEHLKDFLKENPNLPQERQTDIRGAIEKLRKQVAVKK